MLGTTKSSAILQANSTTHKSPVSKAGATWLTEIRQMEATGQTMGLDEELEGLNAKEENGIDVHMMLPTEYGAVAILSASGYGNLGKLLDEPDAQKRTTTGNATGVYFTGNRWEIQASWDNTLYQNYSIDAVGSITNFSGLKGWHGGSFATPVPTGHKFDIWVYNYYGEVVRSNAHVVCSRADCGLLCSGFPRHANENGYAYWHNVGEYTRGAAVC